MKSLSRLILIVLAMSLNTFGQTPNKGNAKAELELANLVRAWDEAYVKGDTSTLDRLLAADFAFVGGPAKAGYLASFKSRSGTIDSAVSSDVQVQVYRNAAVLTGLDTISGKNNGRPFVSKWRYMDVWIKRNGRWQCVKTYSSLVPNRER